MSLNALRQGSHIKIGPTRFLILQKLSDKNWQLQNTATGEWCKLSEDELLDRFTRNELVFDRSAEDQHSGNHTVPPSSIMPSPPIRSNSSRSRKTAHSI